MYISFFGRLKISSEIPHYFKRPPDTVKWLSGKMEMSNVFFSNHTQTLEFGKVKLENFIIYIRHI
jgi:hypothetical protein